MPEAAKPLVEKAIAEFTAGTRKVWTGPIRRQDGSIAVPAGTILPPDTVRATDFFVEGVVGSLPR